MTPAPSVQTILVGGHESADGADLVRLESVADGYRVARPGRHFHNIVSEALSAGRTVVVVPMTFGRNPTMVADAAKTLKWLGAKHPGRLALSNSFGSIDHLTARLRTAANTVRADDPDAAIVAVARRSNPFDEAELHRVAYLVSTHGAADEVFPAIADDAVAVAPVIARLRRLGIERVALVPAGFAATLDLSALPPSEEVVRFAGPLMTDTAIARIVRDRVSAALAGLAEGSDGIDAGLDADHGHGYAHSHAFEDGGSPHTHGGHPHPHPHGHPHTHADGTTHSHDHDGLHAHVHAS